MALPELSWQFVYARLAWALVLAALLVATWPRAWRMPRALVGAIVGGSLLLMALPGAASPAWHLGLAFQYPSGLLVGLCVAKLLGRWSRAARPSTMPPLFAAVLAVFGTVLYLDAFGLLARGYYYGGFGSGAAVLAVLLAAGAAAAVVRGQGRVQACAVLGAVALFSIARLPTGNLADALLDPLLCGWALVALASAAVRALLRRGARPQLAPAPQDLPALNTAGAEPFSPIKE
jgi:hypothetical protein